MRVDHRVDHPARRRHTALPYGHNEAMSRSNIPPELEAVIIAMADAGMSSRQIAQQLGIPRSTVKRRIDARREAELADVLTRADDVAAFNAVMADTSPYARAPFTFDGMEVADLDVPGVDSGKPVLVEWFLDADGNRVTIADVYRADQQDGSVDRGYIEDAVRQIEQAGYRQSEAVDGRWHWNGSRKTPAPRKRKPAAHCRQRLTHAGVCV